MMKGQIAGLMRQAQQMQENMKKAQDALADILVEGAAGGNLVKVTMTCRHDVKRVTIDPSLLAEDKDMLEDLVAAAFNDALRKAEATSQEKMSAVTAGLPLPPGMKLPFWWIAGLPSRNRWLRWLTLCGGCPGWACARRGAWRITFCSTTAKRPGSSGPR